MRKLIPLILITFLWVGTASAYITAEERKKFDDGLSSIHRQNSNYNSRKEADRQREIRERKQKQAKAKRLRELEAIADRNTKNYREQQIRRDRERFSRLKRGQCMTSEVTGGQKCK